MSKTAEGLRSRLFDVLDGLLDKSITTKEVEAFCYASEQIMNVARHELDMAKERNSAIDKERQFQLTMKREEANSIQALGDIVADIEEVPHEE